MGKRKSILVIDDSPQDCMQVAVFMDESFEIILKSNYFDALMWLKAGNIPDCVITEFFPDSFLRYELLRYLKYHPKVEHVPVIVLTSFMHPFHSIKQLQKYCSDYLYKGMRPDLLRRRIELALHRIEV